MIERSSKKPTIKPFVLTTKYPFSFLPYLLKPPADRQSHPMGGHRQKLGFVREESTPAPAPNSEITKVVLGPVAYAEMSRNEAYAGTKARIPKLDKIVVYPMPGSHHLESRRLRSGQVDWIEVPPPDSIPSLETGRPGH